MEYMNNFLRRKTYRTCAVLISGAAMVMAATVVNENENNIAKNEAVDRQAILSYADTGDGDEDVAPGYLSFDRVYFGSTEEIQTDKPQIEAAVIPQVGIPETEEAKTEETSTIKEEASQTEEATKEAETVQTEEAETEETATVQTTEAETEEAETVQTAEAVTEEASTVQMPENNVVEDATPVMGSVIKVNSEEYESLQRIVEAEAGNQDDIGRILVANVVLNRVKSNVYPDTILENIFRHSGEVYQFHPVKNGTYYSVTVSEKTKECVDRALAGEDYSQGALYFTRKTSENSWFNTSLTFLFVHGAHYFYK